MSQTKILIVDDEPNIVQTVRAYLERESYAVQSASDGLSALKVAYTFQPDLIVLDIMLPGIDGLEMLRQLRQTSDVYVLLLTAKADETDKIVGLTVGADDYLTKPFSPRELVARIKAILRRGRDNDTGERTLIVGSLRIDPETRQVWNDSRLIDLTTIEFDILHALARHPGRVLSREQIIEQVWGYDYYGDERVVDVHIGRLRKKLNDEAGDPEMIGTVRGVGYRLEAGRP
ncbi:MAG: response regulator transcription factor [Caldilineae bacterium]|nr:response regulator transcription factor [Anaerolineae bacterium]MCB0198934.1 response regulator transcription factor [Anaerolineae bacterium]MCB0204297.1 response regulator transcription factor [Anaerolineae bacterium]MCB0252318.1 response regulator transcription factor [Anaerolineae bacterium]MCB9153848.1 response regulator transcription factor [Caldilineae bacterium]